jgi:hypothetical protein
MDDAEAMETDDLEEHYVPEGGIRIGKNTSQTRAVTYGVNEQ